LIAALAPPAIIDGMASSILNKLVRAVAPPPNEPARANRHAKRVLDAWQELLSNRGEVSGALVAHDALTAWRELPASARPVFFSRLAQTFTVDHAALRKACEAYLADNAPAQLRALQAAAEPPLQELFRRLNQTPGGTAALIEVRKHVLAGVAAHADWQVIDAVLADLFTSWFNRGFLTLQRIDWHTPAFVLEKLIEYEAVHEISGWRDLRRRLQSDRRCFGFFHPALLDEPLIFIEVALVRGISRSIQPLLDLEAPVEDPQKADTAVFYSITNCQPGLRGVSFGNLLIKQVAQKLGEEFPRIKTFSTLSPIPGFTAWLQQGAGGVTSRAAADAIAGLQSAGWHQDAARADAMKAALLPLCAHYLLTATHHGAPADPVARFHLGNGARAEKLNWLADTSARGLRNCAGMMVNYVYHLDDIEENHEAYVREHRFAATHELRRLAREGVSHPASKT
jgi:malonyl-CoA decarboxylase